MEPYYVNVEVFIGVLPGSAKLDEGVSGLDIEKFTVELRYKVRPVAYRAGLLTSLPSICSIGQRLG